MGKRSLVGYGMGSKQDRPFYQCSFVSTPFELKLGQQTKMVAPSGENLLRDMSTREAILTDRKDEFTPMYALRRDLV